jgi:excisionase family DNA binding protein
MLLRVEKAAEMLSLSRAATYQLIRTGDLPSIVIGRSRRVPLAQLEQWISERSKV